MLHLEIVTPEKLFFSEDVDTVIVRGLEGDLAIMKNRAPITTPLKIGKVRIIQDGKERVASVVEGYVSYADNLVTLVTDAAEWPGEIDFERAEKAKRRAEEKLKSRDVDTLELKKAEMELKRAINRLDLQKYI